MVAEWKASTWGELATLEYGKGLTGYEDAKGSFPVYGTNGQIGWHTESLFDKPGVIIGRKGAYRGVHYSKSPFFVIDTAFYLCPKIEIDLRWAYYQLLTIDINSMDSGSAIPSTSRPDFYALPVLLPPLPEQHAIAEVLGALDDKIELNRRMNATLEEMAQALFKEWFVDSEEAKGWDVLPLSNVCDSIYSGGTPSTTKPDYWDGEIPWLSSGETREKFIIATDKSISKLGVDNSSTRYAHAGSTVIASAGQGKTRGQTSLLMLDTYINQSVVVLKANEHIISDFFLFFNLSRRYEEFRQISDSHSSRGSLTTRLLGQVKIVVPPCELISSFEQIAKPIIEYIRQNLHQSLTLTSLRDALQPRLMRGEVRVTM